MMITYVKPTILSCGKSEDLIKGECGWGKEDWTLDQTGAKKNKTVRMTYQMACPGPGVINICTMCETRYNQCSNKSNEC